MKKAFKAIGVILLSSILLLSLFGCNSIEYKYNIKRFVGDYWKYAIQMVELCHYDSENQLQTDMHIWWPVKLTEDGWFYDNNTDQGFHTSDEPLDINFVNAVNECIARIGDGVSLSKKGMTLKGSGEFFKFGDQQYDPAIKELTIKLAVNPDKLSIGLIYEHSSNPKNDDPRYMKTRFWNTVTAVSGDKYEWFIMFLMERK